MTTEKSTDPLLENNSYYDIDLLNRANRPIFRKIEEWSKKKEKASSWLGKWYCQVQIDKWTKKLYKYQ